VSAAQAVLQALAPQIYGLQSCSVPGRQVPMPSHLPAIVPVPAVHDAVPHTVAVL